jgi:hypothetical protein
MSYTFFYIGFVAGAGLFALMWWLSDASYRSYLEDKGDSPPATRTALKIRGKFYYILRESEYTELLLRPLRMRAGGTLGASPFADRRKEPRWRPGDCAPDGRPIKPGS